MVKTALALLPLLALWAFAPHPVAADPEAAPPDPSRIDLVVKRVVVFKDGHALFVREGEGVVGADGRLRTSDVPDAAVLGTFWALAEGDRAVGMEARVVERKRERSEDVACGDMRELLAANVGRELVLELAGGGELRGSVVATLERVAHPDAADDLPGPPPAAERPLAPGQVTRTGLSRTATYVHMRLSGGGGERIVPIGQVQSIGGAELVTTTTHETFHTWTEKELAFVLGKDRAGQTARVTVLHFGPGLRWIPTYRLTGDLEGRATLALQAELLNQSIALHGVPADLVVGVPHFTFSEVTSPLTLEAALRNALAEAAPQLMGQVALSNASFASRAGERVRFEPSGMDIAPELATEGAQDLFVYSLPSVTLPVGGRAAMPLWQSEVPLSHVYTLDLDLGRDARGGAPYVRDNVRSARVRRESTSPLELAQLSIWHQLELVNDASVPWTTGAALTMKGRLPLGQDMLTYTPRGGKSLLPLTLAVDMRAHVVEEEIQREPDKVSWQGHGYMRIVKRSTVEISSYRDEPSSTRVRMALGGRALEASDGGTIRINDFRADDWTNGGNASGVNNHSDIEWRLELQPGEVKKLTVTYEFYIR
ncbi:MAG: hypothetical protein AB7T63_15040 [Planctomycetota bacterium]